MTCWATEYIGQPADKSLANNCLGYVSRMLREKHGREFPNFLGAMRKAMRGEPLPIVQVDRLRDATMVVCGDIVNPAHHVGLYCREADRVIHADTDFGKVRAQSLWRLKLEWRSVLYYDVMRT